MKKVVLIVLLGACLSTSGYAQSPVKARDLKGTWRLELEIDKDGDSAGESAILHALSGFLGGIDVQFEFRGDHELKVVTNAFGEEEVDYGAWHISENGELILDESGSFEIDDTIWMFKGRRLQAYAYKGGKRIEEQDGLYLRRVD